MGSKNWKKEVDLGIGLSRTQAEIERVARENLPMVSPVGPPVHPYRSWDPQCTPIYGPKRHKVSNVTLGYIVGGALGVPWPFSTLESFWLLLDTFGYFDVLLGTLRYFWVPCGTFGYLEVLLGTLRYFGVL